MLYSDFITKSITKNNLLQGHTNFQGQAVLNYFITYPSICTNRSDTAAHYINTRYRTYAYGAKKHIINTYFAKACHLKSNLCAGDYAPMSVECEMTVMYENRGFLSIFFDTFEKVGTSTLATMRHADTISVKSGKCLPLGCFFHMGCNFTEIILDRVRVEICQEISQGNACYFADWGSILPHRFDPRHFYLADDGIVVYFPEYQIATKQGGLPSFLVPYSAFGSGLKYDL